MRIPTSLLTVEDAEVVEDVVDHVVEETAKVEVTVTAMTPTETSVPHHQVAVVDGTPT